MFFSFSLDSAYVTCTNYCICICCRWACFRQNFEEIDYHVKAVCDEQTVNFQRHIGGGYYVSVTTGFYCVDFRKFFIPYGKEEIKPTRQGVALRIFEWAEMRKIMDELNNDYPALGTALPCYLQNDHSNQLSSLECKECYPFGVNV